MVFKDLISSYLSNRKQYASINQKRVFHKDNRKAQCFFLIYMNDLNNALNNIPRIFADNTCLIVKFLDPNLLQNKMNSELEKLHLWFCA